MSTHDERLVGTQPVSQDSEAAASERAAAGPATAGGPKSGKARRAHGDEAMRDDRALDERAMTQTRELTDDERLELFNQSRFDAILPDLPDFPGYHTCWLTTQNPRDSIARRLQLGYELITTAMCPGWDGVGLRVGPMDNVVGVNEMVAARIRRDLYVQYMRKWHHLDPLNEEQALRAQIQTVAENARRLGASVSMGDGVETLSEKVAPPKFAA